MEIIVFIAILLMAIAFLADAANNIYSSVKSRKSSENRVKNGLKNVSLSFTRNKSGDYLVTKYWYKTDHRSTEIVSASDPADAFEEQSDGRRNLDYYIESLVKL